LLLGITGIKVARKLFEKFKKWRSRRQAEDYDYEERS
jgi:hypothetical protein